MLHDQRVQGAPIFKYLHIIIIYTYNKLYIYNLYNTPITSKSALNYFLINPYYYIIHIQFKSNIPSC